MSCSQMFLNQTSTLDKKFLPKSSTFKFTETKSWVSVPITVLTSHSPVLMTLTFQNDSSLYFHMVVFTWQYYNPELSSCGSALDGRYNSAPSAIGNIFPWKIPIGSLLFLWTQHLKFFKVLKNISWESINLSLPFLFRTNHKHRTFRLTPFLS